MQVASMKGDNVSIECDGQRVKFKNDYFVTHLAMYVSNPPDISQFFTDLVKNSPYKVSLPAETLLQALTLASAIGGDRESFYTYMDLGPEGSRLRANGDHPDEVSIDLNAQPPQPLRAYINNGALLKSLRTFHRLKLCEQAFEFSYSDFKSPLVIKFSEDGQNLYASSAILPPNLEPQPPK